MTLTSFRLMSESGAGFHFGREGMELEASVESFPSDSLFAALVVAHTHVRGDPSGFLEPWVAGQPPWVTSSVFPFVGDLPLLPVPRLPVNFAQPDGPGARKGLKRLLYVTPRILEALLKGAKMDAEWHLGGPRLALQGGAVWLHPDDLASLPGDLPGLDPEILREERVWTNGKVPRVAIDRMTGQSNIFFAGRTVYAEGCGLWFAADVRQDEALLRELLGFLGDSGIGGERNAGYGHFTVAEGFSGLTFPPVKQASRWLTLSRYYPLPDELEEGVLSRNASYELVDVGGWMGGLSGPAQRRRHVRMVEAGSVITHIKRSTPGGLVDVRPKYPNGTEHTHPVYRAGFALVAGVDAKAEEA